MGSKVSFSTVSNIDKSNKRQRINNVDLSVFTTAKSIFLGKFQIIIILLHLSWREQVK